VIFTPAGVADAWVVELERHEDDRGWFARAWSRSEFAERGLATDLDDLNLSFNARRGTIRGMHFQLPPHHEVKLVRCVRGAVHDVILDLRPDSPTYRRSASVELSAANGRLLYIPPGFAHGFQTLEDETEILYAMVGGYEPSAARGVRWDDPAFALEWRDLGEPTIAERDRSWPDFADGLYPLEGLRGDRD
jgi:dTDP-4-dehydrorhamnose 3,5-epimerase